MRRRGWMAAAAAAAIGVLVIAGCSKDDPQPTTWVVGDSLTVGTEIYAPQTVEPFSIDAEEGRTTDEGIEAARSTDLAPYGEVIVALGTNDYLDAEAEYAARIDEMMEVLGPDVAVTWINVDTNRSHLAPAAEGVNAALTAAADRYANLTIADWSGAMATMESADELYANDEIHYSPEGYRRRAAWMASLAPS